MSSLIIFLIFIPCVVFILLIINFILASHQPYAEKDSPFECGFHSFLGQNRTEFNISFYNYALLFLLFDIEILFIYPFTVSNSQNGIFGLVTMLVFCFLLSLGLAYELGKNALKIASRQKFIRLYRQYSLIKSPNKLNKKLLFIVDSSILNMRSPGISLHQLALLWWDVVLVTEEARASWLFSLPSPRYNMVLSGLGGSLHEGDNESVDSKTRQGSLPEESLPEGNPQ